MASAGILEVFRLKTVNKNDFYDVEYIPISIFWQVPQYFLVGFAEVFTFIGEYEFFYDQAPDSLRSLCSALFLTTYAGGNFLSTVLVSAVTKVNDDAEWEAGILGVIIGTPIYDQFIVPFATKFTGREQGFTQLQRIGIGLAISVFAMVSAGILEVFRLKTVNKNDFYDVEYIPISIFWQVPQYFLVGFAESLCSALFLTTYAGGNFLSPVLVSTVAKASTQNGKLGWIPDNLNKGHLDYFYWLLAILSLLKLFFLSLDCEMVYLQESYRTFRMITT
ncbi:Proton-dependent oligopeptide transporter family [Trema orientale]|uniref:Proton-dependent oligopeptide transporter family n=1 Tax=Trema orientale TaxID=63057 RepID=A0A2P5CRL8_TREOI|nr:Proton-dependent oligopeptide transporter family [Trema orientale]